MALEEFEDQPGRKDKNYQLMRSIRDFAMGILWLGMGLYLTVSERAKEANDPLMRILGGIFIIYGIFRIYRGYKKNYYNER
jgi:hypothetical protein